MKKRNIYFIIAVVIVLIILLLLMKCMKNNVCSRFDSDDEGWQVSGDVKNAFAKPDYHEEDGNPGGYVSATDETTGGIWYWDAPEKFLGSKGGALNKKLSFDLIQSDLNNQFDAPDVILQSGDQILVYKLPSHPDTKWTSYTVGLSAEAGWKKNDLSGPPATKEDLKSVLSKLTNLRIRGEYVVGPDVGSLDNVCLYLK
jgi:hypothetical protein